MTIQRHKLRSMPEYWHINFNRCKENLPYLCKFPQYVKFIVPFGEREKKKERKINIALSLLQFWLWLVLEIQYSLLISCFPIYGLERGVLIKCEAGSIFIWNSFHFLEFIHNWSFQRNCEIPFLYLLVAFIFVAQEDCIFRFLIPTQMAIAWFVHCT